jgi:hypothetical protein
MKKIDPIVCFDSIQTLRKHLKDLQPDMTFDLTPNDFTKGCIRTMLHSSVSMSFAQCRSCVIN